MACIVHMSVPTHITACFCISLWCLPSSLSVLRWKNTRMCGRLLAPLSGITLTARAIHSLHYTLTNSYKMVRAPRLCSHWLPHRRLTALRPQAPCPAHSYHTVPSAHKFLRAIIMPTSLAEALTQLSFLEFLQRCNLLIAPPEPPQLPVPISPLDAATQTLPHRAASRDVSTQTCARPVSSLSLDAAVQTPLHSVVTHDVSTQQPLTEFFIGCILSNDPLDRHALSSAHCNNGNASSPQPPDITTLCSTSSASHASDGHEDTTAPRGYHSRHRVSRNMPVSTPHMVYLLKRHRCDLVCVHPCQSRPRSHMSAPPKWEPILCAQLLPTREVQVPPLRKPTILLMQILEKELILFPNHEPWFFLWSNLGNPNLTGLVTLIQPTAISCIFNTVSVLLQWNPGPARRNRTNIIAAACGKFHAVILQEASDHVPHIFDQFLAYTGNTDLAILLNKDTFEPDPMVLAFKEDSTSKSTWGMVLLIVRGLLRRPSLSGAPTVTLCSVHIHNVVAKKRDASTDLLHRLHGKMKEHNVDFIGGDFNMSAFSTVGDVVLGSRVFSTW